MQPYLFPYIGYYQLVNAVDTFVIYDDVNFIKQGWINRNRLLLNGSVHIFTVSLRGASSFKKINEIEIVDHSDKIIATIQQAYRKAPYFDDVFPILINALQFKELNLAKYLIYSLKTVISYLGINTTIIVSSEVEKNDLLKGEEKVIEICKRLKASTYINSSGGKSLYTKEKFKENGLDLNFIIPQPIVYSQFRNQFIPSLSIIDLMMFNSKIEISEILKNFILE